MKVELTKEEYNELVEFIKTVDSEGTTEVFNAIFSPKLHIPECTPSTSRDENGNLTANVTISSEVSMKFFTVLNKYGTRIHKIAYSLENAGCKSQAGWLAHLASHASEYINTLKLLMTEIRSTFRRK